MLAEGTPGQALALVHSSASTTELAPARKPYRLTPPTRRGALLPSLEPRRGLLQLSEAMSDTAASLEQRALECEQKARHVTNEASRQTFFELARAWRELAAAYDELGRKGAEPEVGPTEPPVNS